MYYANAILMLSHPCSLPLDVLDRLGSHVVLVRNELIDQLALAEAELQSAAVIPRRPWCRQIKDRITHPSSELLQVDGLVPRRNDLVHE